MSIQYKSGNLFQEPTEAIVNTVNCVGVMGKGVALEFKKRWPENYKAYKILCDQKRLVTGKMFVFETSNLFESKQRYLINFPTKAHWRSKSKLSYIEEGLDDFVIQIKKNGIKSVAIPPLGCGNGGLNWDDVRALIENKLENLSDVQCVVFPPNESMQIPEFKNFPDEMTVPRAALVKVIGDFESYFGGHLTRLSIQKLAYFLQVLGVDFGLKFSKENFGPYSSTLHSALKSMEAGKYIEGYSSETREITTSQAAFATAEEFLNDGNNIKSLEAIQKLSHLIEGFESPFGMELLASVHYLHEYEKNSSASGIMNGISTWNNHKKDSFGEIEVNAAISRLKVDSLLN